MPEPRVIHPLPRISVPHRRIRRLPAISCPGIKSRGAGMKKPWVRVPDQSTWRTFEAEAMPHVERLFRLAMWLERNRGEAEDLVQEALAQALQSIHRYTPGANCRAWLTTILQHVRSNRRRAPGRSPLAEGDVEPRFD